MSLADSLPELTCIFCHGRYPATDMVRVGAQSHGCADLVACWDRRDATERATITQIRDLSAAIELASQAKARMESKARGLVADRPAKVIYRDAVTPDGDALRLSFGDGAQEAMVMAWWNARHDFCLVCEDCGECHHSEHENRCPADTGLF